MTEDGEVIFDGNVDDWESVDTGPDNSDFNDYDLEFIDMKEVEEGDYWIGEYTGIRAIGGVQNALFDNGDKQVTYGFTPHAILKNQLEEVEEGETVAVVYEGTTPIEGQPNDAHVWDVRRPPE